ncbi:chorismate synthase [Salsuginibacillus halophilus]|uniref:Chorismate synthase n=1 Tax=Salsuginibacillus halophilus TaxID=517424 RepID=A0A2P8HWE9_9BACI|nr:chorismate synthase [Salsuginibacillus halophilus]PSL50495.1 chorismate synthase [Salsuginibacillus halophilus]
MRYVTSGESHGPQLTAIIEGLPAQMELLAEDINQELARRQGGYGRGRRMQIETDTVEIKSGVRHGKTTGAPVTLVVENDDFKHWEKVMGAGPLEEDDAKSVERKRISRPRPGHADLNGALKYGHRDMRDVLERSSARETTVRVAVGAVAKKFLAHLGIDVAGQVLEIGGVKAEETSYSSIKDLQARTEASDVRCLDETAEEKMKEAIDDAKAEGDSIGGVVQAVVEGVPIGLGSHVHYDRKLDANISRAVMSINAFKGVEIGIGFEAASLPGSQVHDEIAYDEENGYYRKSNNLGGFEGGMTNGMPVVVQGVMKPIPTLYKPLQSVDVETKEAFNASIERSDSCAVPAASVVAEHVVAWEIAAEISRTFESDRMDVLQKSVQAHHERVRNDE